MWNILLHFSRYSIALNLLFTTYTFSPTFPNFLSSLPQMEPMSSQVRNHHSQKNQEAHLERALRFKKAANPRCPSNVCLQMICHRALSCWWLMSQISILMQDDDTKLEISDDKSEDPGETTISSDINEDYLERLQEILFPSQAHHDKSLQTTRVPLPMKRSHANTVIACPLLPDSRNPAGAMIPRLLKRQKSILLNNIFESEGAPSTQPFLLSNSSGDQNVPQPMASADQNVPQKQKATFEVAKSIVEAIVFRRTPWPISSDDQYSMVEEARKLADEAQDRQRASAGAPVGMPSGCQLPGSSSLKIDLQTGEAESLGLCFIFLYQILDIDYTLNNI